MYVCSCFGVTEAQVHAHQAAGACTPRDVASACKAGTDCGSCVRRIQALLGRGGGCVPRAGVPRDEVPREEIQARLTPVASRVEPVAAPRPVLAAVEAA
ncbi:bacterioferritin-associated ferredoxin [Streptantibioticus rubrisoli]|uniref:Bacterioferritin-associated ferredoxin n=1 Tax=Streptantibioticus rubrisoli TaxID=1387313 RepID=A0ABT1PJZ6_9ACTN|nr:(2Fe-2S)-binding protein [Streptantibioticus rubrisoli]MCQ4045679.1 (2Fe-2S)-binding protein [Streptantibioticus rubrisoli]